VVVGARVVVGAAVVVVVRTAVVLGAAVVVGGVTTVSAAFEPPLLHALSSAAPPVKARSRRREMRVCGSAAALGDALMCSELLVIGISTVFCSGPPQIGARAASSRSGG